MIKQSKNSGPDKYPRKHFHVEKLRHKHVRWSHANEQINLSAFRQPMKNFLTLLRPGENRGVGQCLPLVQCAYEFLG